MSRITRVFIVTNSMGDMRAFTRRSVADYFALEEAGSEVTEVFLQRGSIEDVLRPDYNEDNDDTDTFTDEDPDSNSENNDFCSGRPALDLDMLIMPGASDVLAQIRANQPSQEVRETEATTASDSSDDGFDALRDRVIAHVDAALNDIREHFRSNN